MGRADFTKQLLYDTALKLFAKDGFEKTTMRAIAAKAGVAPGASYYYFSSKESLIQDYYERLHVDHEKALEGFFEKEKDFEKRLHHVVRLKIELAEPHKEMARALYRVAANPESPLSPFSVESKELRLKALKIFERILEGSNGKFHASIQPMLPKYLWMYQMAVILHWIYDTSEGSKRTYELIDKTVPLIVWFNDTLQSAWAAPFRKKIVSALKSFEPDLG
jgi:AcrR family transcriptional regulator